MYPFAGIGIRPVHHASLSPETFYISGVGTVIPIALATGPLVGGEVCRHLRKRVHERSIREIGLFNSGQPDIVGGVLRNFQARVRKEITISVSLIFIPIKTPHPAF